MRRIRVLCAFRVVPGRRSPRYDYPMTVADLIVLLQAMPQDLEACMTNGDLPVTPVTTVAVGPADYGQLVLISG